MGKKSIASFLFVVCGLAIIGFVSFKAFKENKRNKQIEQEIAKIQAEADKVKRNNQELEERIGYFQTPEFQEKMAKDKLNFQKNDEEVVIIKSSPSVAGISTVSKDEPKNRVSEDRRPNYQKWWQFFFKY